MQPAAMLFGSKIPRLRVSEVFPSVEFEPWIRHTKIPRPGFIPFREQTTALGFIGGFPGRAQALIYCSTIHGSFIYTFRGQSVDNSSYIFSSTQHTRLTIVALVRGVQTSSRPEHFLKFYYFIWMPPKETPEIFPHTYNRSSPGRYTFTSHFVCASIQVESAQMNSPSLSSITSSSFLK